MSEFQVTHSVMQTVEAESEVQAEALARRCIELAGEFTLWYPVVAAGATVTEVES